MKDKAPKKKERKGNSMSLMYTLSREVGECFHRHTLTYFLKIVRREKRKEEEREEEERKTFGMKRYKSLEMVAIYRYAPVKANVYYHHMTLLGATSGITEGGKRSERGKGG